MNLTNMNKRTHILSLLLIAWVLLPLTGTTQDDEIQAGKVDTGVDTGKTPEEPSESSSREVDVSEDTYRHFMELKDVQRERDFIPETVFQPKGNLQKIDELPEDSQKHLRNQLREVILQGEQWKPGDEQVDHPYTPSEAARTNQSLQKLEAEAWAELLGEYHQREAEIYANSTRSNSATASATNQGEGSDHGEDADNGKGDGKNAGDQASQEQNMGRESTAVDGYSPNASAASNSSATVGISQNALEFLTGGNHANGQQQTDSKVSGELVLPGGTLAIKDLVNARGVIVERGIGEPPVDENKEQENDDG